MSKSRGNVVSPDDIICKVGSDAFRLYLMFGFSYIEGGPWNENGIESITKFMDRVERIVKSAYSNKAVDKEVTKQDKELLFVLNSTIQKVTADTEIFSFNTAIARIMELVNALYKYEQVEDKNYKVFQDACYKLIASTFYPLLCGGIARANWRKRLSFEQKLPYCRNKIFG